MDGWVDGRMDICIDIVRGGKALKASDNPLILD